MARRSSFWDDLAKAQRKRQKEQEKQERELQKAQLAHNRAQEQLAKAREIAQKTNAKDRLKAQKEFEKEQQQLYLESRITEVDLKNEGLDNLIQDLEMLLKDLLETNVPIDLDNLKSNPQFPTFYPSLQLTQAKPLPKVESYRIPQLTPWQKLMPGAKRKYEEDVAKCKREYEQVVGKYEFEERKRLEALSSEKRKHDEYVASLRQQRDSQHAEINQLKNDLQEGKPDALVHFFMLVLESSVYPDDFPQHAKLAYVPESHQLVIEYDLPVMDIVPEENIYKYNKSKDEITSTVRPMTQRKSLYASVVSQVTLRTLHELFAADEYKHIETIVFNGYVETVDKGTGRDIRTCLVTIRTSRDIFLGIDLSRVDPEACLKTLNASVSKSPSELAPVRPVLEFSMVDPRFVQEADVISTLDQRPNLMELSPSEFESLITNLFHKMGLEARQTQASRDGGVDCVAYDPRPIFGGKVIIQAKRYKNTVGVSAVRDLFGTLQNEGASKGILVTTSGYGKAAFDFAANKPLELLSGSNLLHLLQEHAGIEAKIEIPAAWKDPIADVPES